MVDDWAEPAENKKCILLSQRLQRNSEHHVLVWRQREVSLNLMCKKEVNKVLRFHFWWSQRFQQAILCPWIVLHWASSFPLHSCSALKCHFIQDIQAFQIITKYIGCLTMFKDFSTSPGFVTVPSPGIHHHQHTQTFKTNKKNWYQNYQKNSNVLKGYVYKVCVPFTLLSWDFPDQTVPGKDAGKEWTHFPSSDNLGNITWVPAVPSNPDNLPRPQ